MVEISTHRDKSQWITQHWPSASVPRSGRQVQIPVFSRVLLLQGTAHKLIYRPVSPVGCCPELLNTYSNTAMQQ